MQLLPAEVREELHRTPFETIREAWAVIIKAYGKAALGRADRFYLLTILLHRKDAFHPWLYARCREVEANPDGYLDLWAREHYKSTLITFAGCIQEILNDPGITIGIFSHTKPTAKKFLVQIKEELEGNAELHKLYPDVLWERPDRDSPRWSTETGIVVKRESNPKEATVEAHGLVDGQPIGAHFSLLVYDDVVTAESVSTPEQVAKTTAMHSLSDNLGARGADGMKRKWHIGTRYHFGDTYQSLIDRKVLKTRIYAATDDGTITGKPVFLSDAAWARIQVDQLLATIAAQMLQNPAAGNQAMFDVKWLRFIDIRPSTLNVYIVCDPASSRKKGSDSTSLQVWGLDAGRNRYLLDGYHHKMGLTERWMRIREMRRKWQREPGVQLVRVGYERYGSTSDLEYFQERMEIDQDSFEIVELAWPLEGPGSKYDRIQRLEPHFRNGRVFLAAVPIDAQGNKITGDTANQARVRAAGEAYRIFLPARRTDHEGKAYSLNSMLLGEFKTYPYSQHDDALDCASRVEDMDPRPPILIDQRMLEPESFVDGS